MSDLERLEHRQEELVKMCMSHFDFYNLKLKESTEYAGKLSVLLVFTMCSNIGLWIYFIWGR